jgi:hypothetical protein
MATYILKRKIFTMYDETDNLKRMKDSDILAEKKKQAPGFGGTIGNAVGGAAVVGTTGAVLGGAKGLLTGSGARLATAGSKAAKYGKWGAAAGALTLGGMALKKRNEQARENEFYNKRLAYAQRQAMRRERKDWKSNMTQRDGYSY